MGIVQTLNIYDYKRKKQQIKQIVLAVLQPITYPPPCMGNLCPNAL